MIRNNWRFLALLCAMLLLQACVKESFDLKKLSTKSEFDWGLGGPVAYGDIRLSDAVKRANSRYLSYVHDLKGDSIVQFAFDTTLKKLNRDSFVKLPYIVGFETKTYTLGVIRVIDKLDVSSPLPCVAGQDMPLAAFPVDYLTIKSGTLTVSWSNPASFTLDLKTGKSLSSMATIASATANNVTSVDIELDGKTLNAFMTYRVTGASPGLMTFTLKNIDASRGRVNGTMIDRVIPKIDSTMTVPITMAGTRLLPIDGKRIDTLVVKKGVLDIEIANTFKNAQSTLRLLESKHFQKRVGAGLVPFVDSAVIASGETTKSIDLTNAVLCAGSSIKDTSTWNSIPLKLRYSMALNKSADGYVEFDENWGITINVSNPEKVDFRMIRGYLGSEMFVYSPEQTIATNMGKNLGDLASAVGGITFTNPRIELDYISGIGMAADITMNITGIAANGNSIKALESTEVLKINAPKYPGLFNQIVAIHDTIKIDSSKTKTLGSFFNIIPEYVGYDVKIYTNPGLNGYESLNFIDETSNLDVRFRLVVPMQFTMKNVRLSNDFPMDLKKNNIEEVESVKLTMNFTNQFPLDVAMNVYFLDSLNNKLDSLPIQLIKAAKSDPTTGKVEINPTTRNVPDEVKYPVVVEVAQNSSLLKSVLKAKRVKLTAVLNSYKQEKDGSQRSVTIYSYYKIKFQMGAEVKLKYNGK